MEAERMEQQKRVDEWQLEREKISFHDKYQQSVMKQ